jgi:hypothetical protein
MRQGLLSFIKSCVFTGKIAHIVIQCISTKRRMKRTEGWQRPPAREACTVAKNAGGRRVGAIRGRTQFMLPNGHYAKRNRHTGEILSIKWDKTPYRNVIIERDPSPSMIAAAERFASRQPGDIITLHPIRQAA